MWVYSNGLERYPRGRFCFARHSASSPQARESDPTVEAAPKISNSLMAEDGRIKLRRAYTRLTVSKAVSTLNGLRLPRQNACASLREGTGVILEPPARLELAAIRLVGDRSFH